MRLERFIKQKSYEKVIYVLRRHPITFIPTAALFIALFAIPLVLYVLIKPIYTDFFSAEQIYPLLVLGTSVYYLSIYLFFYGHFIDFYLDFWIVTNDRIIDNEQHGLFHHTTTELELHNIQDVTSQTKGIIGTFFKFGDVTIKTSSVTTSIVFRQIAQPAKIREALIQLADADRKHHNNPEKKTT
jgi:membrane protein YdbS with pleckstrin-like domain